MKMSDKFTSLIGVFVLFVLLVNCLAQALNENDNNHNDNDTDNQDEQQKRAPYSLIDWNSYTKLFNKDYSTPLQALARQRIFLSKNIKVFLTNARYKLSNMGYYSVINKFSDLTPEEEQRKLSGDGGEYPSDDEYEDDDDDDDDNDHMDDEQVRATLMKALAEQEAELGHSHVGDGDKRVLSRRRRSLLSRTLSFNDLVRVPGTTIRTPTTTNYDDDQNPQPELKIKWIVASNNPDYKPVEHVSYGSSEAAAAAKEVVDKVDDIPVDKIDQIGGTSPASWYSAISPLKTLAGFVGVTAKGTYNWLASPIATTSASPPATTAEQATKTSKPINNNQVIIDWRKSGCVAPPMDQGNCQSCYAVSSTAFLEWAFCMNRERVLTPLSVQYMVSCGPQFKQEADPKLKIQFYGCDRGRSRQAMYFIKNYGAELAVNMPYLARDTNCPVTPETPLKSKGYIRPNVHQHVRMLANTNQLELALKVGPVIVNFREPVDFLAYGGGMVGRCYQRGGHAMLVVGHGIENNTPYLIIKNSFGTSWGMAGYFKFDRKYTSECVKDFILPRVSFPSKRSQARRVKAYLAGHQKAAAAADKSEPRNPLDLEQFFDVGAGGLFSVK